MRSQALALPGGRFVVPGNRWDLVPEPLLASEPEISVIVPYYQARAQLELMLEALALQDYPHSRIEVIVADDGSSEPLRLPAGDFELATRVVRQEDRGFRAAAARNLAAGVAEGEVLCFLDQDTVPEPAYLRRISRLPALLPDALVVGRRRHADLDSWTPDRLRAWLTGTGTRPQEFPAPAWLEDTYRTSQNLLLSDDDTYRFIISAVMCCTADFFTELGGFDESFTSYGGEDWEFAFRAYQAGAVLAHEPEAVAWHDGPDWAGRGDTAERALVKAEETKALARLIPTPDRSEDDGTPADLLLTWHDTAALDAEHLAAAVQALLDSPINLAVYLDPGEPERCATALNSVAARLHTTPIPDAALTRARHTVTLDGGPGVTPDALHAIRTLLQSGRPGQSSEVGQLRGIGRMTVAKPSLSALTQRGARRAARWQHAFPDRDLVDDLFGSLAQPELTPSQRK